MYSQIGQWILSLFDVVSTKASSATTELISFSNATVIVSSATSVGSSLT